MLISVERYRLITGDQDTAATAVTAAVEEATQLLGEDLGWEITEAERTETLQVFGGKVYPSSIPITVVGDGQAIDGHAVTGAAPIGSDFLTEGVEGGPLRATLTYTGGWTDDTVPTTIARDIAWAARGILNPSAALGVPAGATSVTLGDASVTFANPQARSRSGVGWSRSTLRWHIKHRRSAAPAPTVGVGPR